MDASRVERDIAALADRRLAPASYRRAVLDRLTRAVPVSAGCVAAADPSSLALVAHTPEGIARNGAGRLYDAEYGQPDVASHRSLATGNSVRVLSEATRGELERSSRYANLIEPMGWRHELRAAITDRAGTWGFLHLYRSDEQPDFDADEADLIRRVAPLVAQGMRASMLAGVATVVPASRAPAVLVLDEQSRLVQATPGSAGLLDALRDDQAPDDEPPEVLLDLALLAYNLTPAERLAVQLVLAGRSTRQIAEELVLSPYTVQDRMQDVFAKVGVRSRRELVAARAA